MSVSVPATLRNLSQTLLELYSQEDPAALPLAFANAVTRVIPSANAGYNVIRTGPDPGRARGIAVVRSRGVRVPSEEESPLLRNLHQHPIVRHLQRHRDESVVKFSDYWTRAAYHRTALYNEYYRRSDTQEQMGFALAYEPDALVFLVVNHVGRHRFSEANRAVAGLLRSHLVQVQRTVRRLHSWRELVAGFDTALETSHLGCILLDRDLRAVHINATTQRWLRTFFAGDTSQTRGLPASLAAWVDDCERRLKSEDLAIHPPRPLVRETPTERLTLRFRPAGPAVLPVILVEHENLASHPAAAAALGLTTREAEILDLLARGLSGAEIATVLGISPRTVHKHTEHLYQKLGVENRYAAVRRLQDLRTG